jgi:hypothetical protein
LPEEDIVDFAKLIEQRDKLMADVTARLQARDAPAGTALPSADVQQAQAARVAERIRSLEQRKAEMVARIDAELKELKAEHAVRTRKPDADPKTLAAVAGKAAARAAPKAKAAPKAAAKKTAAAAPPKARKAARGASAKRTKGGKRG